MPVAEHTKVVIISLGAGCAVAVCAAIAFDQRRRRKAYEAQRINALQTHIDRLTDEVERLRTEIESKRKRPGSRASLSSLDDEFVDALEEIEAARVDDANVLASLFERDSHLNKSGDENDKATAYNLLKTYYEQYSQNSELLWRLSRATYLHGQSFTKLNPEKRKQMCFEARRYADCALALNDQSADIHKWVALTMGTVGDYVSMSEKIKDGYEFKKHIDLALQIKPNDYLLHHLAGRWCFGVASLTWIERKVASTLFAEPPTSTYDDALKAFMDAEHLFTDSNGGWKENLLYIAKSLIALQRIPEVLIYLNKANTAPITGADDAIAQEEISQLLSKYGR